MNPRKPQRKLNKKEQKHLETLENIRRQLIADLKLHSGASLYSEHEAGHDMADDSAEAIAQQVGLGVLNEEVKRLQLIDEAIQRLEKGEYGICIDCGCKISEGRLEAKPYAKLCVDCRGKWEKLEQEGQLDEYLDNHDLSDELFE
ncbi:MAG: TraR/DksA family transcriptional regulator [Lentisphaerae bacterium]|nr:MAG: TraR/DksA family transcriptional regulator [Lentisphaerota bacterium]